MRIKLIAVVAIASLCLGACSKSDHAANTESNSGATTQAASAAKASRGLPTLPSDVCQLMPQNLIDQIYGSGYAPQPPGDMSPRSAYCTYKSDTKDTDVQVVVGNATGIDASGACKSDDTVTYSPLSGIGDASCGGIYDSARYQIAFRVRGLGVGVSDEDKTGQTSASLAKSLAGNIATLP